MLIVGSFLAVLSGVLNVGASLLQKREGLLASPSSKGFALILVLLRRPAWLLAELISVIAWLAEAASFAMAPVATVATLRNSGKGFLVLGGTRWLEERFSRLELSGVALAAVGGVVTAIAGGRATSTHHLLSVGKQLAVGGCCSVGATMVAGAGHALNRAGRENAAYYKASGAFLGVAVGLLFTGTGILTKEVADRFSTHSAGAILSVLESPSPWVMILMGIWAQSVLQEGFRRANVAAVSSASAATASVGLILAGLALYGQRPATTEAAVLLAAGIVVSLVGTVLLIGFPGRRLPQAATVSSDLAPSSERSDHSGRNTL